MLRVLLDARTLSDHFPGIGRYTFHLAQALRARDDVHITLLVNPHGINTRFSLSSLNVQQIPFPYSPFQLTGQIALWRLLAIIREGAFNVYHAPYYLYPYAIPLPVVVTAYDTIPQRIPQAFSPVQRCIIRGLKTVAFRRARHILAISRSTAEDIRRFYRVPPHRITVTPLAPPPAFQPAPPEAQSAFRRRYHLPSRYGVYVGSDKVHKNLPFLLKVWERFSQHMPPDTACLVVVGPHQKRTSWPRGVVRLGFLPEEELPLLYSSARVFVFPSLWEGFGLPPLEAMACGTPVLCSDIPPLRETIGEGGLLLPLDNVDAWVEALIVLWKQDEEWRIWQERALSRARAYSWQQTAAATVAGYYRAMGETASP